ncbi:hypothetical protein [Streptococcus mitis]|uniref:hypothetical protein n=1 Tax=Streptococcus mitis TaxID=28037 RepID=UPI00398BC483
MNIKEQTRWLATGFSKYCFEVVESQSHIYGKTMLTWFEEIFEEYQEVPQRRLLDV